MHCMTGKWFRSALLSVAVTFVAAGSALAQEFPWEPASPPVYTPTPVKPVEVPRVDAPKQIVPGHNSSYGYVAPYESDGPVTPQLAPGEKSTGWVPGHHDARGAWVPGHPQ
jgi:hypothetical protein